MGVVSYWGGWYGPSRLKSAEIGRRHEVLDRVSKVFLTAAFAAGLYVVAMPVQAQAPASQPAQKNWKDRAEYDIYNAIIKEQDPAKRITLLNSWKEKYSASDYSPERLQIYVTTYAAMNQPEKVIATGSESLQNDPKNLTVLFLMAQNVLVLSKPEDLAAGDKAANGLLSNLDTFFATDKKPATTSDGDWAKARTQTETLGHTALGWVALQKKDNETAEKAFAKALQLTANNAQVSYWLGTAILQQRKPERQAEALYHFARAASLEPAQGGFAAQARQQIDTYFVNAFNRFHGQDDAELKKLRDLAKAQPFPPADYKLKDVNELKAENEAKFQKENPSLALWMNMKQELTGPNGEQYFNSAMKGAEVPGGANNIEKFKGRLISSKPAVRPKELVLAIMDANTPEVTLILDAPLPGKADPGTEIEFACVPSSFTKEPFNVTFDVEKKKVAGWPGKEAAPPARRGTGTKKSAKKG